MITLKHFSYLRTAKDTIFVVISNLKFILFGKTQNAGGEPAQCPNQVD